MQVGHHETRDEALAAGRVILETKIEFLKQALVKTEAILGKLE